jgi:predicted SnoaL-like aldol condensation-catalyzing enzyme
MNTPKSNKEIVRYFATSVFVNHDLSILGDYMREDYIQHNPNVAPGKDGFTRFFQATFQAIPDFRYTFKQFIADGDLVAVYSACSGTHTSGEWLGHQPTGNRLNFDCVDIFRVQDGKIAEHWDVADTFNLFRQVGVIEQKLSQ